jgi:hypothetical protein
MVRKLISRALIFYVPRLLVGIALLATLSACSNTYRAPEISAQVVDAETGLPIEDAVVLLSWQSRQNSFAGHGIIEGLIQVVEVLTDANGMFTSPAWGPKKDPHSGFADRYQPNITVFKSGYLLGQFDNDDYKGYGKIEYDFPSELKSKWDGKVLALEALSGGYKGAVRDQKRIARVIYDNGATLEDMKKAPCMIVIGSLMAEVFAGNNMNSPFSWVYVDPLYNEIRGQCPIGQKLTDEFFSEVASWEPYRSLKYDRLYGTIQMREVCARYHPQMTTEIQAAFSGWLYQKAYSPEEVEEFASNRSAEMLEEEQELAESYARSYPELCRSFAEKLRRTGEPPDIRTEHGITGIIAMESLCSERYPNLSRDIQKAYSSWLRIRNVSRADAVNVHAREPVAAVQEYKLRKAEGAGEYGEQELAGECMSLAGKIRYSDVHPDRNTLQRQDSAVR